ncbi:hypothetical protein ACOSP7_004958 [Xanthoceras sorbifolium]
MEATDIAKLCETLSLSEKEGPIVHLDASLKKIGMDKMNLCSVGKIISSKIINREAFRTVIPKIWKMAQDPLRRCVRIDLDGFGTISTMLLKYERLPEFCFQCGILGHATRECLDLNHEIMGGSQKFEYGTWLRATSPVRIRKDTTPRSHSPSNNDDGAGVTSGCATQDINVDGVHQQAGDPVHDTVLPMQNLKDAVDTSMTLPTATVIAPILPIPGKLSNDNFEVSHVSG